MDRFNTAAKIAREVKLEQDKTVSRSTVTRRLQQVGLEARVPVSKPLISKKNQKLRLHFAQAHVVWTEEQWSRVHFSDESKFNVIGSDGETYVRRKTGEWLRVNCVKKTVKHGGGSVMVWGVFSAAGPGPLVRLHGRVNAEVYRQLYSSICSHIYTSHVCNQQLSCRIMLPAIRLRKLNPFLKRKIFLLWIGRLRALT